MAGKALKIPFVFGITGHRDLRPGDVDALKRAVSGIFREIGKLYPNSPRVLLSPLAQGADRLAAEVALEEGVELMVPLPMALDEYEKDFADQDSIDRFRDLLSKASAVIEMQLPEAVAPEDIQEYGPARDHQYQQAGIHVALHSHVLIALWDGRATGKTGGTGMIVGYQLEGLPQLDERLPIFCRRDSTLLDLPETGPVYHVATPRSGSPDAPTHPAFELVKTYPEIETGQHGKHGEDHYKQIFSRLDMYNRDVEELCGSRKKGAVETSRNYLFPEEKIEKYPSLRSLRHRFAAADVLAIHFRDRSHRLLTFLAFIFLVAFLCFELFAHISPSMGLLLLYLSIMLSISVGHFFIIRPKNWQSKYEDYRALAEALRVQFFWRLAGLPYSVADYYLRSQSDDLVWIRQSARVCNIAPPMPGPGADEIAAIKQHWVDDQRTYFGKTSKREWSIFSSLRQRIRRSYVAGVVIAIAILGWMVWVWVSLQEIENIDGLMGWMGWVSWQEIENIDGLKLHVWIVVMGFAPALAAAIGYVIERRGFESQVRQYQVMTRLYERAAEALDKAKDEGTASEVLSALGREALAENGNWVLLHRERRIEPMSG